MARASQRRSSKSRKAVTSMEVDFTGIESGGRSISNGWAHGRVKKAEWTTAKESGNAMVKVQWETKRSKEKATVYDNLVNTENALWRFKQMLEAVGIEVPDGAMDVDVTELVDLECDLLIENEDYEGKDQPRVVDYRPAGAAEIDEDKPKRKSKDADEDEDDGEEEEEAPKSKRRSSKDADEDEEEDEPAPKSKRRARDDEDEDEEEPPKRKRSRSTEDEEEEDEPPRKKKRTRDEQEEEDDEEEDPPARKGSKLKIKEGSKVKFKDEDDKLTRGVVVEITSDGVEVKSTKGDVYEVQMDELELA